MQSSRQPLSPIGKVFMAIALIEAFTWAGLLVGMYLKYVSGTTELGVWLFGRLHGAAFMLYVAIAVVAGIRLRWPVWALLLAVLAAVPPLATLPLEYWFRRRGLLSATAVSPSGSPVSG
jgi:integral membrane protein